MGATSGRNLKYIYFFSFCSIFEPRGTHRVPSSRKLCPIGQCFRLLQDIWYARRSSKSRVIGVKVHIERKLLTSRTHFDRSKSIEFRTSRTKLSCRKDILECPD
jgi:hypothetical protein